MTREDWEVVKLGNVCDINSKNIGRNFLHDLILYIDISSVSTGFMDKPKLIKKDEAPSRAKRIISDGDIILSTVRPNRRQFVYIKKSSSNLIASTGFAVLSSKNNVDGRYIYLIISSEDFTNYLVSNEKGSAYPAVDIETISNYEISLPPLVEQQRIASILSAYDDLIENNTRRIALLEQMAQALYLQWFVAYKFPGYQDVEMVDSGTEFGMIPQGREVKSNLKDLISINKGISYKGSELSDLEGIHFVNLKCFTRGGGFRNDGLKKYTGSYKSEKILKSGDLVMAVTDMTQAREIVARVAMVPDLDGDITMSCDVVKIVPENIDKTYLYYMLRFSGFSETIKEMANGANVLHLRPDSIYEYPIIIPSKAITELFKNHCGVIVNEMGSLEKQNQSLKEQRDLLLRKLIG